MLEFRAPPDLRIVTLGHDALPGIERHLLSLDLRDRAARFGGGISEDVIRRYVRSIDPDRASLVGAIRPGGDGVVGLAEAQPTDRLRVVEMAVSVLPHHRRRGLGRGLLAQAVAMAFARGAETAVFRFDPTNHTVTGILRALGARLGPMSARAEIRGPAARTAPRRAPCGPAGEARCGYSPPTG